MDGLARRNAAAHLLVEPDALDGPGALTLAGDAAHHVFRVLRLRPGEPVTVTDGAGRWRLTSVAGADVLEPAGPVEQEPRPHPAVTIATAIPKGSRADVLVQKVAEIGADRIVLLHADRSVVRWSGDRATRHVARLQRIADEATQQSRRVWRTSVEGPIASVDVLWSLVVAEPGGRAMSERDCSLAIGPEGGWTERERALAIDSINLGSAIFRIETAAIVATTLATSRHY